MIRQGWPIKLFCAGAAVVFGCERAPQPPKITESASTDAVPAAAAPTTQELMSGTYKRVSLTPLPLAAQVPQSWDRVVLDGAHVSVLEGPSPGGANVRLSLEVGKPVPAEKLVNVLDGAKREAEKEKANTILCDVRDAGDLKVLEEQKRFHNPSNSQEMLIEWKVTYFVHKEIHYAPYTLDIFGMSAAQFEQSKPLIRKIIDSVVYDATSGI